MKLYTKTGDSGETSLYGGTRVSKAESRVVAYGDVDELNATLGLVLVKELDQDISTLVREIQRDLFAIGARLADPGDVVSNQSKKSALSANDVVRLESEIDKYDSELTPLRKFLLPGGTPTAARLHFARAVCRRAERSIVALGEKNVQAELLKYINRLSDLLFVLARVINHRREMPENEW